MKSVFILFLFAAFSIKGLSNDKFIPTQKECVENSERSLEKNGELRKWLSIGSSAILLSTVVLAGGKPVPISLVILPLIPVAAIINNLENRQKILEEKFSCFYTSD